MEHEFFKLNQIWIHWNMLSIEKKKQVHKHTANIKKTQKNEKKLNALQMFFHAEKIEQT